MCFGSEKIKKSLANFASGHHKYLYLKAKDFAEIYVPLDQSGLLPNNQPLMIRRAFIPDNRIILPIPKKFDDIGTYECEYGYSLRDKLYVTVRFYDKHITDWKSLVISIRELVASYIKE